MVRLLFPKSDSNMQKTTLEKIQERVSQAQGIKTAVIEYNFKELPDDENITPTSFYGVPAKFLSEVAPETATLTYTM